MKLPGDAQVETVGDLGELRLIERIAASTRSARGTGPAVAKALRLGIGDDAAILRVGRGRELVVTTDFSLEHRHFRRDWHTPESAGHRCLARGLSDAAAMGARPLAAFLSLALPARLPVPWVDGFLRGFGALAARSNVPLAGGDTAEAPGAEILADVIVLGTVPRGHALCRSTARAGDRLFTTGSLGGALVELDRLAGGERCPTEPGTPGAHPQSFPEPRVRAGRLLRRRALATACMDLSDGLSSDLPRLAGASGLRAEIFAALLPLGRGATLEEALRGGDDYELLFTVDAATVVPARLGGVALTEIGRMLARAEGEPPVTLVAADGRRTALPAGGWEHFKSELPAR